MYNNGKLITFGTLLSVGAKEVILLTKNKTKKKTNIWNKITVLSGTFLI